MPKLYVVATPIGNLNDLTPRMREALESCDLIAAEDTRVTMKLTQVPGIHKPMLSCHRHNEDKKKDAIVEKMLAEDLTVALTCDAGTPGISDPGEALVSAAWDAGIEIVPVCGPSAITSALSVSGFDTRAFAFYGFPPRENKALDEKLDEIKRAGVSPAVLYESPHRVLELLKHIAKVLPGSRVAVCCDLSKKFERIDRGDVQSVITRLENIPKLEKGEYCVVAEFEKSQPAPAAPDAGALSPEARLFEKLLAGKDLEAAARELKDEGVKRNDVYRAKLNVSALIKRAGENSDTH